MGCRIKIPLRYSCLEMRRNLAGATSIGRGEAVRAGGEKIVRCARLRKQALLGGDMRLDRTVHQDVPEREAAFRQSASDQEAAVAVERLALGAHEAQAKAPPEFIDLIEAGLEPRRGRHLLVVGDTVAIKRRI